jgi:hypothetical protein
MINGMPIQFLNGTDTIQNTLIDDNYHQLVEDVISGVDLGGIGLGSADDDEKIYKYLVKTRDAIQANPELVATIQNPNAMLRMFNYAINNFYTPNRDKALEILEKEEERLIKAGKIRIDDPVYFNGLEGLGLNGFWKSVRRITKKVGSGIKKGVKATGKGIAKAAKFVVTRLNPVAIAIRTGFLAALRLNVNHISEKIAPAYLTPQQAKAAGISEEYYQKAKAAHKKIYDLYRKKMFGKKKWFDAAVMSGKRKRWKKGIVANERALRIASNTTEAKRAISESSVNGIGAVATSTAAATMATATPFIIKATNWIKNLFNNEEKKEFMKAAIDAGATKKEARKAYRAHKAKNRESLIQKAQSYLQQKQKEIMTEQKEAASYDAGIQSKTTNQNNSNQNVELKTEKMDNPNPSFVKKYVTPKNLLITGGLIVAGYFGYKALKSKNTQPVRALNGVRKRKAKSKKVKVLKLK